MSVGTVQQDGRCSAKAGSQMQAADRCRSYNAQAGKWHAIITAATLCLRTPTTPGLTSAALPLMESGSKEAAMWLVRVSMTWRAAGRWGGEGMQR